jgi:DNA-binding MarR family transcriptional regulator
VPTFCKDLDKLLKLVAAFRKVEAEMPMQMAHTFLAVAMQPGITMQMLGDQIGVSQSSISRNVQTLGKWRRIGKPGYDLVKAVDDPVDTRRKIVFLTEDGDALAGKLLAILHGDTSKKFESPSATEAPARIRRYRQRAE